MPMRHGFVFAMNDAKLSINQSIKHLFCPRRRIAAAEFFSSVQTDVQYVTEAHYVLSHGLTPVKVTLILANMEES